MQNPFSGLVSQVQKLVTGDRREYARVDMRDQDITAVIEGGSGRGRSGTLVNLSRIGAAVRYPVELGVGIPCTLKLSDHGRNYELQGKVIYNYPTQEESKIVGVQFKNQVNDPEMIERYNL